MLLITIPNKRDNFFNNLSGKGVFLLELRHITWSNLVLPCRCGKGWLLFSCEIASYGEENLLYNILGSKPAVCNHCGMIVDSSGGSIHTGPQMRKRQKKNRGRIADIINILLKNIGGGNHG